MSLCYRTVTRILQKQKRNSQRCIISDIYDATVIVTRLGIRIYKMLYTHISVLDLDRDFTKVVLSQKQNKNSSQLNHRSVHKDV